MFIEIIRVCSRIFVFVRAGGVPVGAKKPAMRAKFMRERVGGAFLWEARRWRVLWWGGSEVMR